MPVLVSVSVPEIVFILILLSSPLGPAPDACVAYVSESSVASILSMYYTLHTARSKDRVGLMRILGTLASCESDRAFEDPFLHFLVHLFESLYLLVSSQDRNQDLLYGLARRYLFLCIWVRSLRQKIFVPLFLMSSFMRDSQEIMSPVTYWSSYGMCTPSYLPAVCTHLSRHCNHLHR